MSSGPASKTNRLIADFLLQFQSCFIRGGRGAKVALILVQTAERNGESAGSLMVTFEWSDWRNGRFWWIQSVYVRPDWRRQGVFSALYRHVELLASNTPQVIGLRLYVEENNKRAQRTYKALGMVNPSYLVMEAMLDRK